MEIVIHVHFYYFGKLSWDSSIMNGAQSFLITSNLIKLSLKAKTVYHSIFRAIKMWFRINVWVCYQNNENSKVYLLKIAVTCSNSNSNSCSNSEMYYVRHIHISCRRRKSNKGRVYSCLRTRHIIGYLAIHNNPVSGSIHQP